MKTIKYKFKCEKCEPMSNISGSTIKIDSSSTGSNERVAQLEKEVETLKEKVSTIVDNLTEVQDFTGNPSFYVIKPAKGN